MPPRRSTRLSSSLASELTTARKRRHSVLSDSGNLSPESEDPLHYTRPNNLLNSDDDLPDSDEDDDEFTKDSSYGEDDGKRADSRAWDVESDFEDDISVLDPDYDPEDEVIAQELFRST